MADYSLVLNLQHARLCPLTVYSESNRPHYGVKGCASCICRKAGVVESTRRFDRLSGDLELGIGKGRHVVPEEIDTSVARARLVGLQQLLNTGEPHLRNWLRVFVVHKAVEQRAKFRFYRCVLRADHACANHLRTE